MSKKKLDEENLMYVREAKDTIYFFLIDVLNVLRQVRFLYENGTINNIPYYVHGPLIEKLFFDDVLTINDDSLNFNITFYKIIDSLFVNNVTTLLKEKYKDAHITIESDDHYLRIYYSINIIVTCNIINLPNIKPEFFPVKIICNIFVSDEIKLLKLFDIRNDDRTERFQGASMNRLRCQRTSDKSLLDKFYKIITSKVFDDRASYDCMLSNLISTDTLNTQETMMDYMVEDYTQHSLTLNTNLLNIYLHPDEVSHYNYPIINDIERHGDENNIQYQDKKTSTRTYVKDNRKPYLFGALSTIDIETLLNKKIKDFRELYDDDLSDRLGMDYFVCYRFTGSPLINGQYYNLMDLEKTVGKKIYMPYFLSTFDTITDKTYGQYEWVLCPNTIVLIILVDVKYKNYALLYPCNKCFFGYEREILFTSRNTITILKVEKRLFCFDKTNLFYLTTMFCVMDPPGPYKQSGGNKDQLLYTYPAENIKYVNANSNNNTTHKMNHKNIRMPRIY